MARQCVFCSRPANSIEDALPLWLADVMKPGANERAYHHMTDAHWESDVLRSRTKRVCAKCNSVWMSDLENRSKPLLLPMMRGDRTIIEESSKQTLAAWALKTAMMLETAKKGRESHIPRAHHEFLRTYQRPPQQVSIWVGTLPEQSDEFHRKRMWERATYRMTPGRAGKEVNAYLVAMFVDQLVFRIFGSTDDGLRLRYRPAAPIDFALPLWPSTGESLDWPPPAPDTEDGIRAFLEEP